MPARRSLFLLPLVVATFGCSPFTRLPRLESPGNAARQQIEAVYHDPYPIADLGPEVVGGRPLGFEQPAPEVVRTRLRPGTQTIVPQGGSLFTPQGTTVVPPGTTVVPPF